LAELNSVTSSFDFNQDVFLSINNEVPVGGVLTNDEILSELALESVAKEPESEILPVVVSKHEATQHLQALQIYFMQSSEDRSDALKLLASIEKELEPKKVKSKLTTFLVNI